LAVERREGQGDVQWRMAGLSLYIGAEGEVVAGDYDEETVGDKWGWNDSILSGV
jgi:hypothetical protein